MKMKWHGGLSIPVSFSCVWSNFPNGAMVEPLTSKAYFNVLKAIFITSTSYKCIIPNTFPFHVLIIYKKHQFSYITSKISPVSILLAFQSVHLFVTFITSQKLVYIFLIF